MDWGIIFGGIGAAAGLGALLYAHLAMRAGRKSGKLAVKANDLATGSNTIALDARKIAMEANEYSHRAEARETESHDVYWDYGWRQPSAGVYQLIKRGGHEARNIKATVVIDGEELSETSDSLTEDGAAILFRFPGAAREFARVEEEKRRAESLAASSPAWAGVSSSPLSAQDIRVRIDWTTSLGKPMVLDKEHRYLS